ncbi:Unknown protein sequence [Pseudomonas caricapapayae]|uniref:Uncharacterized protein n=1 Tax=Pseudomonas caricapapayae TaxID=46678 RepID=A0A0P9JU23_9PSED|nr:hypothetical protein [Pseudomonas caricapapayae]KAA8690540.1 hypothetical protein F4W67_26225 [Pseudomonas caricapapayae]KPW54589.1 Unknown protein sequence [Pseudomonas caricapapayae]RMM15007.1 hypothetical protein ALQ84_200034 [Pseudomonas caricapapayae]RMV66990.1 hypothetical protein ALP05_03720 [Pseudomonas caricapapayae]RMV98432.1 hypothetical protein ALP01_200161 [Pseudomonas caricapapayae]
MADKFGSFTSIKDHTAMTFNDHFFGQVEISSRPSEAILSLYPVVQLAQLVGRDHFTAQMRRLLSVHGT